MERARQRGRERFERLRTFIYHLRVRLLVLNGVLLAVMALGIVGLQLFDRSGAAVDGSVRRYAAAITAADFDAAMAEIEPARRAAWTDWVRGQLGNVYDVRGIAVRSPSVIERIVNRAPGGPFEVAAIMDVNRDYPEFYQPTTTQNVVEVDGHWYLVAPLLCETAVTSPSCGP